MMLCEQCNSLNTAVTDTRLQGDHRCRRYKCLDCGTRFNTLEMYKSAVPIKNGKRVSKEHLEMVAKQMAEGSAELAALAKLFGEKKPDSRAGDDLKVRMVNYGK